MEKRHNLEVPGEPKESRDPISEVFDRRESLNQPLHRKLSQESIIENPMRMDYSIPKGLPTDTEFGPLDSINQPLPPKTGEGRSLNVPIEKGFFDQELGVAKEPQDTL
jgi:hypothetical protein